MEHAAHLPSPRSLLVPVVALTLGAAGAVGIYALSDGTDIQLQPERVIVVEKQSGTTTNEAATAAAIGKSAQISSVGKDEAATAAAIGKANQAPVVFSKDEAASAAAIGKSEQRSSFEGKNEAATAAAIGKSEQSFGARP